MKKPTKLSVFPQVLMLPFLSLVHAMIYRISHVSTVRKRAIIRITVPNTHLILLQQPHLKITTLTTDSILFTF